MDDDAVGVPVEELEELRSAAQAAKELEERLRQAERQLAFAKAGIDLSEKRAEYLARGYQGELTSEAVRAEAEALGFFAAEAKPEVPNAELEAHSRMAQAMAGGEEAGSESYFDALAKASSADEVMALAHRFDMPTVASRSE